MLDVAALLADSVDEDDLAARGAEQLRVLLDADIAASTQIDASTRQVTVVLDPCAPQLTALLQAVPGTLHDNPLVAYWASEPAPAPSRVSDHVDHAGWRGTSTCTEVLRPMGTPYMLGVPVFRSAEGGPGCAVSRGGSDFTERDLDVASALQAALLVLHRRLTLTGGGPVRPAADLLTGREREVLTMLASGAAADSIARRLQVSPRTVRKHLEHVYRKLDVSDRLTAVNRARSLGVLSPDRRTGGPAVRPSYLPESQSL